MKDSPWYVIWFGHEKIWLDPNSKKKYSTQTGKIWLGVNSVHAPKKLKDPLGPLETEAKAMEEGIRFASDVEQIA